MSEKEFYINKLKELRDMLEDEIINRKMELYELENKYNIIMNNLNSNKLKIG